MQRAMLRAGILKRATCHTLRRSFATIFSNRRCPLEGLLGMPGKHRLDSTGLEGGGVGGGPD
jgi:site-specific recombinase XerD